MIRVRTACVLLVAGVAASLASACFDGLGTLGSVCFADTQCGLDQRCQNSICGLCGDLEVQAGELCFGNSSEENVFGEVADLVAFDPEGDGAPLLAAVVNSNCLAPPAQGPPDVGGPSCWNLSILVIDDEGDFEAVDVFPSLRDGRVPQMAIGDFDGNDQFDVAIAISPNDPLLDPSQLAILYDFPTAQSVDIDISLQPVTLHAADLNGDGIDDLLIAGRSSTTMAILEAMPGGGFGAERLILSDPSPQPAAPVDMNGDGSLDLVISSTPDGTIGVDLNDGTGTFAPQARVTIEGDYNLAAPVTGDFDQDGAADVVVLASGLMGTESQVFVFQGGGDGSLTLDQTLDGGEFPVFALAEDLNFDGWIDIIVADIAEDKLPVHINRGGEFPDRVFIDVAASPRVLMREDFDFDAIPDLVVGSANGVIAVVPSEN